MKKIRLITMICAISLLLSASIYADESISTQPIETLPTSYYAALESIRNSSDLNDEVKIEGTITALLNIKAFHYTNSDVEIGDMSDFFYSQSECIRHLQFFQDTIIIQKETFEANCTDIIWSAQSIDIEEIEINGNTASVHVYEIYEYISYWYPNITTATGENYLFTLIKANGIWYISDILRDSTFDNAMRDQILSIDKYIPEQTDAETLSVSNITIEADVNTSAQAVASTNTSEYCYVDTSRFESYAIQYALSYNTKFCSYNPAHHNDGNTTLWSGDCQNFASQCLWYSLGGEDTTSAIQAMAQPMVTDVESNRQWYQYGVYASCDPSHNWIAVEAFDDCIRGSSSYVYGLKGNVYSGYSSAQVGDILQIDYEGDGTFDHSYVVIMVTGTYGSRTLDDIWVCAHTVDRSRTRLSNISTAQSGTFRTVHVAHACFNLSN